MTLPIATGTYTLLRGTDSDGYSDEIDTDDEVEGYTDLVGSVVEQSQRATRETDQAPRSVRRYVGRFPSWVPFTDGDRLKHNESGDIYTIHSFRTVTNPITGSVTRLNLLLTN